MRVEVIRAWPRRHVARTMELAQGATLADAVAASGIGTDGIAGYAVFGVRADPAQALRDGDRVELLGALQIDPKEARRRRAASKGKTSPGGGVGRTSP